MRRVLIGSVILIILLAGLAVLAVVNINGLLAENRDRLARLVSDAAGREVRFERAEVAFSNGLAVRVDGVLVGEAPDFGAQPFLQLESAYVGLEILPALQRRFEVKAIRLDRPLIRIIETRAGYNFATLGGDPAEATPATPAASDSAPPFVAIAAFEISDGTVVYEDRTSPSGRALTIEELQSSGTDLSLDGPIEIEFSGLFRATRSVDPKGGQAKGSRISGTAEVTDLTTGAVRLQLRSPSFAPRILGFEFAEGDAAERLDDVVLEVDLPADSARTGMPIRLRSKQARLAGYDLSDVDAKLDYRAQQLTVERVTLGLAGGQVEVTGRLDLGKSNALPFDLDTKLENLDSGQLATLLFDLPAGMLSGRLSGEIDLRGQSFDWETLERTLAGQVRLEMGEGALEKVNVLDNLVGRLVSDPGLGMLVANSLREALPGALKGDRTPFDNANLAIEVDNGALKAKAIDLQAGDFALLGSGRFGLDGSLDASGRIRFSESLSRKILAKADRLAPLLADGDLLELPLDLRGNVRAPSLRPNLVAMTAKARTTATRELQDRAASELSDLIFGDRNKKKKSDSKQGGDGASASPGATAAGDTNGDTPDEASQEPTPEERARQDADKLIRKGIDSLFGR